MLNNNDQIKWSVELAYAIGLIASDGCLSRDGRHISLVSKDVDLLKTFKNCLGLSVTIGNVSSSTSDHKYSRVQFGNVSLYRFLIDIGLTPAKSKTIGALDVPDELFRDFLRGYFDGDGSIYAYWDKRWRSSYMFYVQFASGSPNFVSWLQEKNKELFNVVGVINEAGSIQQLRYAKKESKKILSIMYYAPNLPFLERKLVKARKIITIDEQHVLEGI